ncbi:hypothetical protein QFC24_003169 [Naganishia onofrii]|uniref:Uncharacterized protein n=1 Tax=Naganishia onofrii TaxID=1851511 RepID=A0ACC2XN42_9TREE|nr:hypothetical protein QFC24_003169 [Naganishia onofrii]
MYLEDKVGELEAKNAGHEFENENLRQLLAKLQQENMALKNTAFTFSMPMPNMPAAAAATAPVKSQSPPTHPDQSFATAEALRNLVERFSPSQQQLPPSHPLQHRGDSTSSSASGISNTVRSGGSTGPSGSGSTATTRSPGELSAPGSASVSPLGAPGNNVFNPEPFNAFASTTSTGQGSANASQSVQQQQQQQGSSSRNAVSPMDQIRRQGSQGNSFAQFAAAVVDSNVPSNQNNFQHRASASPTVNLDQNMTSMTDSNNAPAGGAAAPSGNEMDWQNLLNNNFTMLAQAPEFMSFSDDAAFGNFAGFSDIWPGFSGQDFSAFEAAEGETGDAGPSSDMNMAGIQSTLLDGPAGGASNLNQFNTLQTKSSTADDALMNMADDNMEEFLRSLGAGGSGIADDGFDMNFIDPSSDEIGAATVDSSGNLGSDLYKQFTSYKSSPAASNAGGSSSLSSAPSSILSPSNYFTTSPDPSSASSISAHNNQSALLPNSQGSSSEYPEKQVSTSSNNESAFRVGTFGGGKVSDSKPAMLRRDGSVVTCDKMWEVVATKIPVSNFIRGSVGCARLLTACVFMQINSGFDLDDLCDRFKQKAKCTGRMYNTRLFSTRAYTDLIFSHSF